MTLQISDGFRLRALRAYLTRTSQQSRTSSLPTFSTQLAAAQRTKSLSQVVQPVSTRAQTSEQICEAALLVPDKECPSQIHRPAVGGLSR